MYKQVIALRQDLGMGKGKLAAQAAHASLLAYQAAAPVARRAWEAEGSPKIVVKVAGEAALLGLFAEARERFPAALVKDAGLTQLTPGTATAVGIGPAPARELDRITGKLKLL